MAFLLPLGVLAVEGIEGIVLAAEGAAAVGEVAGVAAEVGAGAVEVGAGAAEAAAGAGEVAAAAGIGVVPDILTIGAEGAAVVPDVIAGSGEAGIIAGTGETAAIADVSADVVGTSGLVGEELIPEAVTEQFSNPTEFLDFPEPDPDIPVGMNAQGFADEFADPEILASGARAPGLGAARVGQTAGARLAAEEQAVIEEFKALLEESRIASGTSTFPALEGVEEQLAEEQQILEELMQKFQLEPEEAEVFRRQDVAEAVREARALRGLDVPAEGPAGVVDELEGIIGELGELIDPAAEPAVDPAAGVGPFAEPPVDPAAGVGPFTEPAFAEAVEPPFAEPVPAVDIEALTDRFVQDIGTQPAINTLADMRALNYFQTAQKVGLISATALAAGLTAEAIRSANVAPTAVPIPPARTQIIGNVIPSLPAMTTSEMRQQAAVATYTLPNGDPIPGGTITPSFFTKINGLDALTPIATTPNMLKSSGTYKTIAVNKESAENVAKQSINDVSSSAGSKQMTRQALSQTNPDLCQQIRDCLEKIKAEDKAERKPETEKEKKEKKEKKKKKTKDSIECGLDTVIADAVEEFGGETGKKIAGGIRSVGDIVRSGNKIKDKVNSIRDTLSGKSLSLSSANKVLKDVVGITKDAKNIKDATGVKIKNETVNKILDAGDKVTKAVKKVSTAVDTADKTVKASKSLAKTLKTGKLDSKTARKVLSDVNKLATQVGKVEKLSGIDLKSKKAKDIIKKAKAASNVVAEAERINKKIRDLKLPKSAKDKALLLLRNARDIENDVTSAAKVLREAVEVIDI